MGSDLRWPWSWWELLRPRNWRHRWQKVTRGYSDVDVWNLFSYVTRVVLPPLRQLRARHGGYVAALGEDGWDDALDKMIAAFEEVEKSDGWIGGRWSEERGEYYFDEAIRDRTREGLRLFGEHFLDLWD